MYKKELVKIKIKELCDKFKCCSTLAILAVKKENVKALRIIHNTLIEMFSTIIKTISKAYDKNIIAMIENEEFDKLPDELKCLKIVDVYKKFLSYEYINYKTDILKDKIILTKMSIEFNPFDEIPLTNLGNILLEQKKYDEAVSLIQYLRHYYDTAPIFNLSGDIYRALHQYGAAIENYKKYLSLNKKDKDVIDKLAKTYEEALS